MSGDITIRDMEPADREAVIALMRELNRFENAISGDRVTDRRGATACLADDQQKVGEHGGVMAVAERDGAVIGYVCCAITIGPPFLSEAARTYAYVHTLVVAAPARGAGAGEQLLAHAEAFARGQGVRAIAIGHLAGNEGASRLYGRLGFAPHAIERLKRLD